MKEGEGEEKEGFLAFFPPLPALYSRHFSRSRSFLRNRTGTIRLLPIVLALFFGIIWLRGHFFLHLIPKSTASIISIFN